jgi:hypothetical protein
MVLSKDNVTVLSATGNVISLMMRNLGVRGHKLLWQENELKLALGKRSNIFQVQSDAIFRDGERGRWSEC